jgi:predicted negative regulator of RcsB-dependent stress response
LVESDEEQLEVLKNWWAENGTSIVITIVVSCGAIFGYRGWEANITEKGERASAIYENLLVSVQGIEDNASNEALQTTALSLAKTLKADFEHSTYAVFAAMTLAKIAIAKNDYSAAAEELLWALSNVEELHLETVIRVRLARIYVSMGDSDLALELLRDHKPSSGQVASVEEAKGDAYFELVKIDAARQAYERALKNLGEEINNPLLELKLSDLPLSLSKAEQLGQNKTDNEKAKADEEGKST